MSRFFDRLKLTYAYWKRSKVIYDFDYSGIIEAELLQTERTLNSISKYHHYIYWEEDVRWMKKFITIGRMYLDGDWWSIERDDDDPIDNLISGEYISKGNYIIPYINTNNCNRFLPKIRKELFNQSDAFKISLYEAKLWYLYNKIKYEKMQSWWD